MSPDPRKIRDEVRARRHHPKGARDAGREQEREAPHIPANQGVREGKARADRLNGEHRDCEGRVRHGEAVQL